jgi:hypothetical protein
VLSYVSWLLIVLCLRFTRIRQLTKLNAIICEDSDGNSAADGIQIRWKSSDLSLFSSLPSTSSASTQTSASPTTPTTSKSNTSTRIVSPLAELSHHGLSTGAKAGIGVAVALVGLAIIAAIFFLFSRHNSNMRSNRANREAEFESRYDTAHEAPEVVTADEKQGTLPLAHDPHAEALPAPAVYSKYAALHQPETYSRSSRSGQTPGAEMEVLTELPASAKSFPPGQEVPHSGLEVVVPQPVEPHSGLEVVVPQPVEPVNNDRVSVLNELNRLRDRRQRLMELDVLDGEEMRLMRRLAELDGMP